MCLYNVKYGPPVYYLDVFAYVKLIGRVLSLLFEIMF